MDGYLYGGAALPGDLKGADTCRRIHSAGIIFVRKNARSGRLEILLVKRHQGPTFKLPKSKLNPTIKEFPLQAALRSARQETGLAHASVSLFGLDDLANLHKVSPQRYIYRSPHTRERLHKTVHFFAFYMKRQLRRLIDEHDMFQGKIREWKTTEMRWMDQSQIEQAEARGKASPTPLHRPSLPDVLREVFEIFKHKQNLKEVQTKQSALDEANGYEDNQDLPDWLRKARKSGAIVEDTIQPDDGDAQQRLNVEQRDLPEVPSSAVDNSSTDAATSSSSDSDSRSGSGEARNRKRDTRKKSKKKKKKKKRKKSKKTKKTSATKKSKGHHRSKHAKRKPSATNESTTSVSASEASSLKRSRAGAYEGPPVRLHP